MKALEFRLGNLVMDELTKEYLVCIGVSCEADGSNSEMNFSILDRSKSQLPNGWKATPIHLTEELLEQFGFEMDDSQLDPPDTPNGNFWVEWEKDGVRIHMPFFEYLHDEISIEIKHVHSLQNLYFDLTGQPLKLKNR